MSIVLRDYQERLVEGVFREFEDVQATLIVAATGAGKTSIFTEVIRRFQPKRAIVLAHREELIFQAKERIETQGGMDCEIEMADLVASNSIFCRTPVVVATVQTLISGNGKKRMERFDPMDFGLVVVDEAHHGVADSYLKVLQHFAKNPDIKILGVTATPDRADEEALGRIFETVAGEYEILDAIHDGWLVPVDQQMVHVHGLDFSTIRTTAGDLNGADLAAVMESEKNVQGMCGAALEIIGQKRSIVFTSSVRHAEMACSIFNRHQAGIAGWICGKTDKEERRKTMAAFASGKLQVLTNVGCLTEGVDVPAAEVVIMGRPTKSRSLYSQMAGRIMRTLPGVVDGLSTADERKQAIFESAKPSCLIVDFVGNSGRHKLMCSADILGGRVSEEAVQLAIQEAKKGGRKRMNELLDSAQAEIKRQAEERRRAEEARKARLVAKVQYSSKAINPFDVLEITPAKDRGWDEGKIISEKMANVLVKMGVDPYALPYAQAKQLCLEQIRRWNEGLCTIKQANVLRKHGVETKELKMSEAKRLIDQLASNKWQRPSSWGAMNTA